MFLLEMILCSGSKNSTNLILYWEKNESLDKYPILAAIDLFSDLQFTAVIHMRIHLIFS